MSRTKTATKPKLALVPESRALVVVPQNDDAFLAAAELRIRACIVEEESFGERYAEAVMRTGMEMIAVRDKEFPGTGNHPNRQRGGWHDWIARVANRDRRWVAGHIRIAEHFGTDGRGPSVPNTTFDVLLLLVRDTVPEEAKDEIRGLLHTEKVGHPRAKKIIAKHRAPSAEKAEEIARTTGAPTADSEGKVHRAPSAKKAEEIARATGVKSTKFKC